MSALSQWWASREVRERWLIAILIALLALFIYVFAIAAPLYTAADRAGQDYSRAAAAAAQQQMQAQQIIDAASGQVGAPALTVPSLRQSAQAAGLAVQSAVAQRGGAVRLTFENTDAAALTRWITDLPGTQGARIDRLQIQRSAPGRVTATLIIAGPR